MQTNPLISVIIPCYNQARYLAQAIDSVLAQSYSHFEIIVVNDGSTDNIHDVLLPYLSNPKILLHNQPNMGLSFARNIGIQLSHGDFIQFLDSDDWLAPLKFQLQLDLLLADPSVGIAYCDFYLYYEDTGALVEMSSNVVGSLEEDPLVTFWSRWSFPPHVIIIRREWVERIGKFRADLPVIEDVEYWSRALALGCKMRYTPGRLAYYRQHPQSLTKVHSLEDASIKIRYLLIQEHPELAAQASELGIVKLSRLRDEKNWELLNLKNELASAIDQINRKEKELSDLLTLHKASLTESEYHYRELMAHCDQVESRFKEAERYARSLEKALGKPTL